MNTKFTDDLHDVGCNAGCAWPSPIAAGPAKATAGANKESGGNDDGDTPVTTSAVIDADGTAAEIGKLISTVPESQAMEGDVGCAACAGATPRSAFSEAPSMSQMAN